ncbi:MAG: DoxX family membrane protein [Planctomycetaceae bacterium]|nr:DoxX family membrane protein [Planctomycetaceae bacterium]
MSDLKRISLPAIVFLVLLRMSIGWQFLYEGLWKYNTLQTSHAWSSEGYLKNAQGPFREHFREMTGDPDDLKWLDYAAMDQRWKGWRDRFVAHYGLDEGQTERLDRLLTGPEQHAASVSAVPESARPALEKLSNVVAFDAVKGRLTVRGDTPLRPDEAAALLASVPIVKLPDGYARANDAGEAARNDDGTAIPAEPVELEFYKAIETLQRESAKLGYLQRLAAQLKGNPDRVGVVAEADKGFRAEMAVAGAAENDQWIKYGEVQVYRDLLAEVNAARAAAKSDFQHEQVRMLTQKAQAKRTELVGPIRALDAELKREAIGLLTVPQRARGALPPEQTQLWQVDQATIFGLLILGALLIFGLGTRLAALGGAVMLVMFYLPVPPWPGVYLPPEATGPEHSFIINKNLIEAVALLGIAALPTGTWFGLDGLLRAIFRRGK